MSASIAAAGILLLLVRRQLLSNPRCGNPSPPGLSPTGRAEGLTPGTPLTLYRPPSSAACRGYAQTHHALRHTAATCCQRRERTVAVGGGGWHSGGGKCRFNCLSVRRVSSLLCYEAPATMRRILRLSVFPIMQYTVHMADVSRKRCNHWFIVVSGCHIHDPHRPGPLGLGRPRACPGSGPGQQRWCHGAPSAGFRYPQPDGPARRGTERRRGGPCTPGPVATRRAAYTPWLPTRPS